jgi:hypothetical protein
VAGGSGSVLEGENVALTRSTVVDMFLDPSRRQDQAHPYQIIAVGLRPTASPQKPRLMKPTIATPVPRSPATAQ